MNKEKLQTETAKPTKNPPKSKQDKPSPPPPPPSYTTSPCHDLSFSISSPPFTFPPNSTITCNEPSPSFEIDFSRGTPLESFSLPLHNKDQSKHKPSSFLLSLRKWWKRSHAEGKEVNKKKNKRRKKKKVFDVGRIVNKYVSHMVEPLSYFFKGDKDKRDMRGRPHSFSGNSSHRERDKWRKRRRQLSAPASMRTSPMNSGHLSATSVNLSSSDESTMEELQSAIQAAIAHCKKSSVGVAAKGKQV